MENLVRKDLTAAERGEWAEAWAAMKLARNEVREGGQGKHSGQNAKKNKSGAAGFVLPTATQALAELTGVSENTAEEQIKVGKMLVAGRLANLKHGNTINQLKSDPPPGGSLATSIKEAAERLANLKRGGDRKSEKIKPPPGVFVPPPASRKRPRRWALARAVVAGGRAAGEFEEW